MDLTGSEPGLADVVAVEVVLLLQADNRVRSINPINSVVFLMALPHAGQCPAAVPQSSFKRLSRPQFER